MSYAERAEQPSHANPASEWNPARTVLVNGVVIAGAFAGAAVGLFTAEMLAGIPLESIPAFLSSPITPNEMVDVGPLRIQHTSLAGIGEVLGMSAGFAASLGAMLRRPENLIKDALTLQRMRILPT